MWNQEEKQIVTQMWNPKTKQIKQWVVRRHEHQKGIQRVWTKIKGRENHEYFQWLDMCITVTCTEGVSNRMEKGYCSECNKRIMENPMARQNTIRRERDSKFINDDIEHEMKYNITTRQWSRYRGVQNRRKSWYKLCYECKKNRTESRGSFLCDGCFKRTSKTPSIGAEITLTRTVPEGIEVTEYDQIIANIKQKGAIAIEKEEEEKQSETDTLDIQL